MSTPLEIGVARVGVDVDTLLDRAISILRARNQHVLRVDNETVEEHWEKVGNDSYLLTYQSRTRPWAKQYRVFIHRKHQSNNLYSHYFLVDGKTYEFSTSSLSLETGADGLTMAEWLHVTSLLSLIRKEAAPEVSGSERWKRFWSLIDVLKSTLPPGYMHHSANNWYDTGEGFRILKTGPGSDKGAIVDIGLSADEDHLTVNGTRVVSDWYTRDNGELASILWKTIRAIPDRLMTDIEAELSARDRSGILPDA
jgi:hypothetical protein